MIISLDHDSFVVNRQVRNKVLDDRPFVAAGFASDDNLAFATQFGEFAALGEYNPTRLIRKAVSTAVAITQGREVQRRIEIPIIFHDSPEKTGLATSHSSLKDRIKKKGSE
jgi:hypothetical protein